MPIQRPLRVVLVRPRNPNNIGAVARAMGNFGVTDLCVLDPYDPVWQETRSAPGAEAIVLNATVATSWEEATRNASILLATSSFHQRDKDQAVIELPNMGRYLQSFPASDPAVLIFGSERSGLSNAELARCHAVLHIPTDRQIPSMNLGQAVAIVLYEWRRMGWAPAEAPTLAPSQELEPFIESLHALGDAVDYPAGYESIARLGRIRQALQPAVLPASTVRFLLSFTRWVLKKNKLPKSISKK